MIRAFFFFSSRRRHTRFSRDWSSDVCSSDLLDSETILRRTAGQFFLRDLVFHSEINGLQALPATVHFQLRQDLQPLVDILNSAIAALPGNVLAQLQERWLHDSEL